MKFSAALLTNLLAATVVLAAPRDSKRAGHGLASRIARREAARNGNPLKLSESSAAFRTEALATGNATHVTLESTNWAGGILTAPPAGQTFNAVSARFTVPTPSKPAGVSGSSFAASAWVGIDGDTAQNAILQTGVDFNLASSGAVSFDAWFEWFPNFATDFTGIPISAGHVISLSVTATSSSAGTAVIENTSTGVTVTKALTAPDSSAHLQGQNAEWIVEDFEEGDSLVPFADFGTVIFTDAVATTGSGSVTLADADPIILVSSSNRALTTVSFPSTSEVEVTYV
jgi:hypothetical protein